MVQERDITVCCRIQYIFSPEITNEKWEGIFISPLIILSNPVSAREIIRHKKGASHFGCLTAMRSGKT